MSERPAQPRPSSILVLVRDSAPGLETLLLHRPTAMDFGDTWAFPGGVVCDDDRIGAAMAGAAAAVGSAGPRRPAPPGVYEVAAIRECFEETGLLLAIDAADRSVMPGMQLPVDAFHAARDAVQRGALSLAALLARHRWRPAVAALGYMNYWVTPVFRRRRYATRFFVAAAPDGQAPVPQAGEVQALRWVRPDAALGDPSMQLAPPTASNLRLLAGFASVAEVLAWARRRAAEGIEPVLPVRYRDAQGERIVLPGDPHYPTRPEGLPDD